MAISFSCSQCGNDYAVSDGLAGKSAICKACGARMTVPGGPGLAAEPSVDMPADVVGFEEPEPVDPTIIAGAPRRPAARVFTPPQPAGSGGGGKRVIWVIAVIAGAALAGYRGMGVSSKSDVRAFFQKIVDLDQQTLTTLKGVKDVASAKEVSPTLKAKFQEKIDHIEKNRKVKGRKNDIDAATAEYKPKIEALQGQIAQEVIRVMIIPEAWKALDISESIERLEKVGDDGAKDADKS